MAKLTRSSWIKIILITLLCLVICGGMLSCSLGCSSAIRHASNIAGLVHKGMSYSETGNFSVPAQDVKALEINWIAGNVDIVVVDDDAETATVTAVEEFTGAARNNYAMTWQLNNGLLQISYGAEKMGLTGCSASVSKQLVLTLPRSVAQSLRSLDLAAASGTYNLESLTCEQMNFSLASGRIGGNNLKAQSLNLDIASGNVELAGSFPGTLNVKMASGNVGLESKDACPSSTSLDIASGQMLLGIPENSGFTAHISKLSGAFNCNMQGTWEQANGSLFTCGDGSASIDVDMASGNVTIFGM